MPARLVVDQLKRAGGDVFTLPSSDGTDGQLLKTDGSGNLSWVSETEASMFSMTWEEDYLASFVPVNGTWYDITNYSGSGRLIGIYLKTPASDTDAEVRITTDGNSHVLLKNTYYPAWTTGFSTNGSAIGNGVEFDTSLVVSIRRDGSTNALIGFCQYAILSEEFKREIIPAGKFIPTKDDGVRHKVYPFDVMVVWFKGKHGISNKIQFPKNDEIIDNKLMKYSFNLSLNENRYIAVQSTESKIVKQILNDEVYNIEVENGIVDVSKIPRFINGNKLWKRFTDDEQDLFVESNNKKIKKFLYELTMTEPFDLNSNKMNKLLQEAENENILASERISEIVTL